MVRNPEVGAKLGSPSKAIDSAAHAGFIENVFGMLHRRPITSLKLFSVGRCLKARVDGIITK